MMVGPISDSGSPALSMIQGRRPTRRSSFSKRFSVARNKTLAGFVKIIHSAADEDDLWDVVYLTGPSNIGGPTSCEFCGVHRLGGLSSGSARGFASPAFTLAPPGRVPPPAISGLAPKP
jgi:hypothetical protein